MTSKKALPTHTSYIGIKFDPEFIYVNEVQSSDDPEDFRDVFENPYNSDGDKVSPDFIFEIQHKQKEFPKAVPLKVISTKLVL